MPEYKKHEELINQFVPTTIANLQKAHPSYDQATKETNPAFYGSGDWHSAVHSHWQVIRAIRLFPSSPFEADAIAVLNQHLTAQNIEKELENIPGGEVPYGMAWVLLLAQELREWETELPSSRVSGWLNAIKPLESYARQDMKKYIAKLQEPNRNGDHYQTALPLALVRDWAHVTGDSDLTDLIDRRSREFYPANIKRPYSEPGYGDFLSPSLAEADLLRRVLNRDEFMGWLEESYFPNGTYPFVEPPDNDYLSHEYGLNISRAFMSNGIASASEGSYRTQMLDVAEDNYSKGLPFALYQDIGVSHWVPTYIMYYVTRRGIFE